MDVLYDYNVLNINDLRNKLFCTFTLPDKLDFTLAFIQNNYQILHHKIFILEATGTNEFVCTYNPDYNNMNEAKVIPNTILLHRKKETNTLYSINSLNIILKDINKGSVDRSLQIDWNNYRNCMLITRQGELTRLDTKIHSIVATP